MGACGVPMQTCAHFGPCAVIERQGLSWFTLLKCSSTHFAVRTKCSKRLCPGDHRINGTQAQIRGRRGPRNLCESLVIFAKRCIAPQVKCRHLSYVRPIDCEPPKNYTPSVLQSKFKRQCKEKNRFQKNLQNYATIENIAIFQICTRIIDWVARFTRMMNRSPKMAADAVSRPWQCNCNMFPPLP